ncbi:hypothetical protein [Mycobacterium pseudokansasii]|uniref:hypothetical protein n=2 Tax=Mycobacterium pseudokansasii TaxID=2341080 RepID=UPI001FCEE171|nr:hypothetical protein [Mycobacterium pseudokansasii]
MLRLIARHADEWNMPASEGPQLWGDVNPRTGNPQRAFDALDAHSTPWPAAPPGQPAWPAQRRRLTRTTSRVVAKAYPARDLPATAATDARFMTALPTIAALAIALGVGYCFGRRAGAARSPRGKRRRRAALANIAVSLIVLVLVRHLRRRVRLTDRRHPGLSILLSRCDFRRHPSWKFS